MKKITFNILINIILICLITYTIVSTMIKNHTYDDKNAIIVKGYYHVDKFEDHNTSRSHSDLYKYYYTQEDDIKFENNPNYKRIEKNDVTYYINIINGFFDNSPRREAFDLNKDTINENDYYYIDDDEKGKEERFKYEFCFYYYKIYNHVLYEVYCNE